MNKYSVQNDPKGDEDINFYKKALGFSENKIIDI